MDLPNTPVVVEQSSADEPMENLEDHLEVDDDPKEGPALWDQQAD